jgi:hypothetical protein
MTSLKEFNLFAASRGEGLHPKLRDLFERAANAPCSEVMIRHDGMLQSGPNPESETSAPCGNEALFATHSHAVVAAVCRRPLARLELIVAAMIGFTACPTNAKAELGRCTAAAPTRPEVVVFTSDIDRSARWYQDRVGLVQMPGSSATERRAGSRAIVLARNGAGITLVPSVAGASPLLDPQMVCFLLDGPPAPLPGSKSLFLVDPDGTLVELPALPGL